MKSCIYDTLMAPLEQVKLKQIRRDMLAGVKGNVLDIGSGTGASMPYYRQAESVTFLEPDEGKLKRISRRTALPHVSYYMAQASAENMPFSNDTFDEAAAFLAFCTIPDPIRALHETARVVKPGGRIQLLEHVRMDSHPRAARIQDILTPAWERVAEGCQLNRSTRHLVEKSPLRLERVQSLYGGLVLILEAYVPF
ncbi:class I SAM-dependent methyltransferase [Sinobaca sp. H24]|uniref:class I SAM-dependent methyltransferase n=1 Tax=Sinobaca sp. H24 TaxID=2923376 RepID=UPI002079314A|nr:class I SAM-dependent methyltransferase [Sinobaca sp. H24]